MAKQPLFNSVVFTFIGFSGTFYAQHQNSINKTLAHIYIGTETFKGKDRRKSSETHFPT